MDLSRYVIVTIEGPHLYFDFLKYIKNKHQMYSWAVQVLTANDFNYDFDYYKVFIWWKPKKSFSATPLRSALKRLKDKYKDADDIESFRISKALQSNTILQRFPAIVDKGTDVRPEFHLDDALIAKLKGYHFTLHGSTPLNTDTKKRKVDFDLEKEKSQIRRR